MREKGKGEILGFESNPAVVSLPLEFPHLVPGSVGPRVESEMRHPIVLHLRNESP